MTTTSTAPCRFVVLRHDMPPGAERPSHWDLMLEAPDSLETWALAEEPRIGGTQTVERLANHRKAYLDYEGPVSGHRGQVTRWDRGSYRLEQSSDSRRVARLHGARLRCVVWLEQLATPDPHVQRWTCRFERAEPAEAC